MCNEHALQEVGALFAMFDHPLEGTASTYSKFFFQNQANMAGHSEYFYKTTT